MNNFISLQNKKSINLHKHFIKFILFYALTKNLFDYLFGPIFKVFFYVLFFVVGVVLEILNISFSNRKKEQIILFLFFVYIIYIALNIFFNSIPLNQLVLGVFDYLFFPLYFFACTYYVRQSKLQLNDISFISNLGVVISLLAIVEFVRNAPLLPSDIFFFGRRAVVFNGSSLSLCLTLGVVSLYSFYEFLVYKKKYNLVKILLLYVGMFVTGSRGPMGATIIATFFQYSLLSRRKLISKRKKRILTLFLFILTLIISFSVVLILFETIGDEDNLFFSHIRRLFQVLNFRQDPGNINRKKIWDNTFIYILEKPILGHGISIANLSLSNPITEFVGNTESGFLRKILETGIFGFIFYFFIYLIPCLFIVLKNKKDNILGFSILILFLIENLVLPIFNDVLNMFIFWLLCAIIFNSGNKVYMYD